MTRSKKWFTASVDFLLGFGCGFGTTTFYVKAVSLRTARKRIKDICKRRNISIYNLGSPGNRGINCLREWIV